MNLPGTRILFYHRCGFAFSIESWKCPQSLLSDCTILAACRDEKDQSQVQEQIDYLKKKYQAGIELLLTPIDGCFLK